MVRAYEASARYGPCALREAFHVSDRFVQSPGRRRDYLHTYTTNVHPYGPYLEVRCSIYCIYTYVLLTYIRYVRRTGAWSSLAPLDAYRL